MLVTLPILTHAAAFVGYLTFALLLAFRGARTWLTAFLIGAATVTAGWAATTTLAEAQLLPEWTEILARPVKDASWFALILAVLYAAGHGQRLWLGLLIATLCGVALDIGFSVTGSNAGAILGVAVDSRATSVATAILGLILIENMMRNLSRDQVWGVKLLGIGLGAVQVYQLAGRLPEFLTGVPASALGTAMPLVYLIVLPLFMVTAVRNPVSALRLYSSRRIVFHTTTIIAVGVLLLGTAIAAYYIRQYGGDNTTALAIVIGFSALVAVAVAATSGGMQSRLRRFINENFFSYKFDYRLEWDRFIRALSAWEDGDMPLRALRTLAELLDSPGGALWVMREHWNQFMPVAQWSYRSEFIPIAPNDPALKAIDDEDCAYLELTATEDDRTRLWRERFSSTWLVVPLRYRNRLIGLALLNRPRADRKLDWEDKNLIALVALQLAAYLVQEETVQALADARQLEEFNKRFAFILHDTKNAIGQLSLLVRNVEQFGHDEDFRKDMVVTLRNSVDKLQGLLARLRGEDVQKPDGRPAEKRIDATELVRAFVQARRKLGLNIVMAEEQKPVFARLPDENAFLSVLDHVLTNAVEAAPKDSPVAVGVASAGSTVRITIADRGPGMSQEFIANQLFRPLRTTKQKGFGIGSYQARQIMRDLGGGIDVRSKVGEGTTVGLTLPTIAEEEAVQA